MATNNGSLDTNLLLRWLLDDEPAQTKRVDALLAKGGNFRVSDMALFEVIYALEKVYGYPREDVAFNMRLLLGNAQLLCNRILFDRAVQVYVRRPKLSFADCYLAAETELTRALPLYTLDRKLANQSEGIARLVP